MTPIRLDKFLQDVKVQPEPLVQIDLNKLGLYHSAPVENGRPILAMRFDSESGMLVPSA